jgi:hypothetical protein
MNTPWAILLTHFSDDVTEPFPKSRYEEIFTPSGAGKWNMVDFFRDMSHGILDLSGSKVFGWFKLKQKESDYTGSGANPAGRNQLIQWARDKAVEEKVKVGDFFSVVVVLNKDTDLFGGSNGVVCDDNAANLALSGLSPSYLGQEMGHTYGLRHARQDGSTADYMDPLDIMSTASARMAKHPTYTALDPRGGAVYRIGPGLNAASMAAMGWLDMTRLWTNTRPDPGASISTSIQLRPLHRPDLPGFLAARLGDRYFIELRLPELWDKGFEGACVLVHYFEDGHSYIVSDDAGNMRFTAGSVMSTPANMSIFGSGHSIRVESIDPIKRVATVQVQMSVANLPQDWPLYGPYQTPWIKWLDTIRGDHALAVVNGGVVTIPRGSIAHQILEKLALSQSTSGLASERLRASVQHEAIASIAALSQGWLRSQEFGEPAQPRVQHHDPVPHDTPRLKRPARKSRSISPASRTSG